MLVFLSSLLHSVSDCLAGKIMYDVAFALQKPLYSFYPFSVGATIVCPHLVSMSLSFLLAKYNTILSVVVAV